MDIQVRDKANVSMTNATTDAQVIDIWLRSKSEATREAYLADSKKFFSHVGKSLHEIKLEDLLSFKESLNDAESTNYRRMSVVKSLLTFANQIGYLPFNVGRAVTLNPPKNTLSERIVSHEAIHSLIDGAESQRDTLLVHLVYKIGMRTKEVVRLKWRDLNDGVLTVQGKGEITRNVKIPKDVLQDLLYFRGNASNDDAIFTTGNGRHMHRSTAWRIVKRALDNTDIDKEVSTHWLRHAHVSHALDNGAPIHLVAKTVGHASLQTTSKYAHARPDESSGDYL